MDVLKLGALMVLVVAVTLSGLAVYVSLVAR